ncbi:nitrogen regulation protein NR(II) [Aliivibrio fischeri]|uniref:Sensory histidine kinase/phosphatase NtrB n=5 Tax=Vibrionaceae TaxID=641 RepID=Q5E8Q5_ALIF1|nr:nitrogen regulatory sensory histidine kinase in two-component regulatory system with NtrC [Aliivibrio fischeri ES114]MUH96664.1 nitrogen regulation protein NR(II) [Aliivibrio fischeri]MUI52574.1 nitrogen regulation protein NR(II) [Aliivibrio fischeri]MUI63740.1 nitrogen regulation protein NR(II) [Aliivibrio fischeri]MUJ24499.1 nitrogen regulation protein NR(II) [Aliivibrio fischeri]
MMALTMDFSTQLLEHQVTAILLLDDQRQIHYANPAAEQLFSQSAQRMAQHAFDDLFHSPQFDLSTLMLPLNTGQSVTDSDVRIMIDEQPLYIELTSSPVAINKSLYLLVEIRQIEQQRRLSQEINQHAQQQAAKVLVRSLAHEIKNPLGGLRGAAQLLERMLPERELHEYTQIIIEQADRLRNLVDRLLGPQKLGTKQPENLHAIIEKVRQLIELNSSYQVKIIRDYDPSLPDFDVDAEQIEQAILNIVSNAAEVLKDQPDGTITLKTRTDFQTNIYGQRHKLAAKIDIIDNGPGIPSHIQDTLFYPMVSAREGGTGLGLSISQNLIDQHNGKIDVSSWPGKTIFTIYLPLK